MIPRLLRRCLALVAALLLSLTGAEFGLRACRPGQAFRVFQPGLTTRFTPRAELMPGVQGPSEFRVSSLGFRAAERPSEVELSLLALGGSTTECLYLDQSEAWPAALEGELGARLARRAWVANAGRSGRTTQDHALQLERLLAQEPRFDCVLLLTGVNDLCAWLATGVPAAPAELARAFEVVPRARIEGPWWKRSACVSLLRGFLAAHDAHGLAQDPQGAIYATWRAHRRAAARIREELPDPGAALAVFHGALDKLALSATQHGTRLVLVTQPALWKADLAPELAELLWMGGAGDYQRQAGAEYYSPAVLAQGLACFNAELEAVARAHGLALLDLARALDGDPACFYDDVHFNEEGARRVATFLAEGLSALLR
ncbi:MAG: hypothetical protein EXS08_12615 [Planctomycetes bacterium]|nr:hypothetical protein [Planctomycetota bacterium]